MQNSPKQRAHTKTIQINKEKNSSLGHTSIAMTTSTNTVRKNTDKIIQVWIMQFLHYDHQNHWYIIFTCLNSVYNKSKYHNQLFQVSSFVFLFISLSRVLFPFWFLDWNFQRLIFLLLYSEKLCMQCSYLDAECKTLSTHKVLWEPTGGDMFAEAVLCSSVVD